MWDVFSFEKGDVTVSAVNIFFYMSDPQKWDVSASFCHIVTYWE